MHTPLGSSKLSEKEEVIWGADMFFCAVQQLRKPLYDYILQKDVNESVNFC